MTANLLRDRRILAVEDEYYLAVDLERELVDAGAHVLGPVPSIQDALAIIESPSELDGAVLDINLGGTMSFPVADALMSRSVPFVITTGYVDGDLAQRYPNVPRCEKPTEYPKLLAALMAAIAGRARSSHL